MIPKLLNPFDISASAGAPPDITNLNLPPSALITCLNSFLRISICNFNKKLLIFNAILIILVLPCFSTSFIIVLYIASTNIGTPTKIVTLYSFKFFFIYLNPSGNTVFTPEAIIIIMHVDPNI